VSPSGNQFFHVSTKVVDIVDAATSFIETAMERYKPPFLITVPGEEKEKTNLPYHKTRLEETVTLIESRSIRDNWERWIPTPSNLRRDIGSAEGGGPSGGGTKENRCRRPGRTAVIKKK
jgi:hypothetical protein